MAMKEIEATKELIEMIEKSAREWKKIKSHLEEEHQKYDMYCEDEFGLRVDFSIVENADVTAVVINGAEILDDDKYINFLLKFGNMHNE